MKRRDFLLLRPPADAAETEHSASARRTTGASYGRDLAAAEGEGGARPFQWARDNAAELSCEQLYMRFVDAEADGTTARLFDVLAQDLTQARVVRLTDRSWLARADLNAKVDEILAAFVARGGRVA